MDSQRTAECPTCLGGAVTEAANDLGGFLVCRRCGGSGRISLSDEAGEQQRLFHTEPAETTDAFREASIRRARELRAPGHWSNGDIDCLLRLLDEARDELKIANSYYAARET
jgi:hypothetical protein